MKRSPRILALLLAGLLWPAASADEVDDLLSRVKPPARFADHKPRFRAQEADFSWRDYEKSPGQAQPKLAQRSEKKLAVFDGDRLIGYMHTFRGAWREIHMFAWKPDSELLAQVKPDDWDREYMRDWGDCLPLIVAGYHEDAAADEQVTRVEGGGESLTFIRNFTWKPTGREKGLDQEALQTNVLRVHPQLGYVIDQEVRWKANRLPVDPKTRQPNTRLPVGLFFGFGAVNPWPGEATYQQGFFTPGKTYRMDRQTGKSWSEGCRFASFRTTGPSIEGIRHGWHPLVRPNGLMGYIGGRDGWGVGLTSVPADSDHLCKICPAWAEFHVIGPPIPEKPDGDGYWRVAYRRRMVGLPPEVQELIRREAKLIDFGGQRALMIRLDGEDFEDQPLPLATPHRGMRFVDRLVKLTEERAHSGRKAVVMQGIKPEEMKRVQDRLYNEHPQCRFDLNTKYRLECWAYVDGTDTEAFVIARQGGPPDGSFYLQKESVGSHRTDSARSGEGWKKVALEFNSGPRGGVLFLGFAVVGPGKGYFDGLRVWKVTEHWPESEDVL